MSQLRRRRTYSFLLLELLIALTLFSICVMPLASVPINALYNEIKIYQRLQLHRISDLAYAHVKALLYQNQISWEEVSSRSKSLVFKDSIQLNLQGLGHREIERSCTIRCSAQKEGKNQEQYKLVTIEVRLTSPNQRKFFVFKQHLRDSLSFYYKVFVVQPSEIKNESPHSPELDPMTA